MQAEVNADILGDEKIEIIVMDENSSNSDSLLGTGKVPMRKLCSMFNKLVEMSVDLSDEKGATVGRVSLNATLTAGKLQDVNDGIPESAVTFTTDGLCQVHEIALIDMDASLGDRQKQPTVHLQVDDWSSDVTLTRITGTRGAMWKESGDNTVVMAVTHNDLLYKRISLTVSEKKFMKGSVSIGVGDFALRKLGSSAAGTVVEHIIRMKDGRGRPVGRVRLMASLMAPPAEEIAATEALDIDDLGELKILRCEVSQLSGVAAGKKVVMVTQCGSGWMKLSPPMEVKAGGVDNTLSVVWEAQMSTSTMPVGVLRERGLTFDVKLAGNGSKTPAIATATLPTTPWLIKPGDVVQCEEDLKSGKKKMGKVKVEARYIPTSLAENEVFSIPVGDESVAIAAPSVAAPAPILETHVLPSTEVHIEEPINQKLSTLEESLQEKFKEVIHHFILNSYFWSYFLCIVMYQELLKERNQMMKLMAAQNSSLNETINELSKAIVSKLNTAPAPQSVPVPVKKPVIREEEPPSAQTIPRVKLPLDVRTWRNAHVLAWLAFRMELPQYMESFAHASVDGLVLTRHITADTLRRSLEVTDELHVQKLTEGIKILQQNQVRIDEESELERLKRIRRKKEEEDYARKVLEEQKQQRQQQAALQQKQKKRLANSTAVKEVNVVVRTKIERDIRLAKTEQIQRTAKDNKKASNWRFEYTGGNPPESATADLFETEEAMPRGAVGTRSYQKAITLDILEPTVNDVKPRTELKDVPVTCSTGNLIINRRIKYTNISVHIIFRRAIGRY